MKFFLSVFLILLFCTSSFAQKKINTLVHKSKTIDPGYQHLIYDYRIPDWGYHRFYMNFSTNLYGNDYNYGPDSYYSEYKSSQYQGRFQPYFYSYRTSERYIFSIYSTLSSDYQYDQNRRESEYDIQKDIYRYFNNNFNINGNLNQYIGRLFYLSYNTSNTFQYYENRDHSRNIDKDLNTTSSSKNTYIRREYDLNARFGFGLGRIRNVNPVFRALRFNERLKDLGKTKGLTESEVKSLIYLYAHETAYNSTFDRSKKYFYEALPEKVTNQIKNLQPWEMLYLDEVSDEIIGTRNEGFEIDAGIQLTHQHAIYTNVSGSGELTLVGAYAEQRYYHNISPGYQIGTRIDVSYLKVLNENTMANYFGRGTATIMNLWNITDRMLMDLSLGYETGFATIDDIRYNMGVFETYEKWHRSDRVNLSLSMDYFLENNLSIGATISNRAYKYWPQNNSFGYDGYQYGSSSYKTNKNWSAGIDLRYYIIRGMY
ncbi:MAG: hypothetical protein P8X42_04040 [Calditrichaceae bacterium]|jgi:hypothetical protein